MHFHFKKIHSLSQHTVKYVVSFSCTPFSLPNLLATTAISLMLLLLVFLNRLDINSRWTHTHVFIHMESDRYCFVARFNLPTPSTPSTRCQNAYSSASFFTSYLERYIKWVNHNLLSNTTDNEHLGLSPIFFFFTITNIMTMKTLHIHVSTHAVFPGKIFLEACISFWWTLSYFLLRNLDQ